jgi:DNA-directed RNA polymerase specialized sigma24 family protein
MDAPLWKGSEGMSEAYPEEAVRVSFGLMTKACLCAGLSLADSEDVAQDIWMWMLRARVPIALIATPWLKAVVHNYLLRHRRRSYCRLVREGQPLDTAPEPKAWQPEARLESKDLLDRVASLLPERERKLLGLIRRGYSLPEASRLLGIPAGSRDYYQRRLIACARRELKPRAV